MQTQVCCLAGQSQRRVSFKLFVHLLSIGMTENATHSGSEYFPEVYITYLIKQSLLPNQVRLQKAILHFAKPLDSPDPSWFSPFRCCFLCLAQESSPSQLCLNRGSESGDHGSLNAREMTALLWPLSSPRHGYDQQTHVPCWAIKWQQTLTVTSPHLSKGMTWECRSLI